MIPSSEGGLWTFLRTLFYPIVAIWRFINNFLFAGDPTQRSSRGNANPAQAQAQPETSRNPPSVVTDADR